MFAQTLQPHEVLVIEDAKSLSEEVRAVVSCDPRIKAMASGGRGASVARNIGIRNAESPVIAFLDDDDVWHERKMEAQMAVLSASDIVAVTCTRILVGRYGKKEEYWPETFCREFLYYDCFFGPTSSLVYRKDRQINHFFDEALPSCQDWDFIVRLRRQGEVRVVRDAKAFIRLDHGVGERITARQDLRLRGLVLFHQKHSRDMDAKAHSWVNARCHFLRLLGKPLLRRCTGTVTGLFLCVRSGMPIGRRLKTGIRYAAEAIWGPDRVVLWKQQLFHRK